MRLWGRVLLQYLSGLNQLCTEGFFSVQPLCPLCLCGAGLSKQKSTTETQRTQRLHREKASNLARLSHHLVHFSDVEFFFSDHPACVVFKQYRPIADQIKQLSIKGESFVFGLQRLGKNVVDAMLVSLEQAAN